MTTNTILLTMNDQHISNAICYQGKSVPCSDELNLYSLTFDDFSLTTDTMMLAAVSMFLDLGLVKRFNIEKEVNGTTR